jgi:DNA-binding GntR family transcriptional regulator
VIVRISPTSEGPATVANDGVDIGGTVRERAARELRDRILTGALPAGSRLDLDAITKE